MSTNLSRFGMFATSSVLFAGVYFGPFLPSTDVWPAAISNKINSVFGNKSASKQKDATNAMLSIGVVIPVYNEGKQSLLRTLRDLERSTVNPSRVQVVVVDGGCTDDTMDALNEILETELDYVEVSHQDSEKIGSLIPQLEHIRGSMLKIKSVVVNKSTTGGGRGPTLNCGVQALENEAILLFLHADTLLPTGYDDILSRTLSDNKVMMTAFSFAMDSQRKAQMGLVMRAGLSWIERSANTRSRNLWLPYGDQALAMSRNTFDRFGGFPAFRMMEDFELVQRIRHVALQEGKTIVTLSAKAECSMRRWESKGLLLNTMLNWLFVAAYSWGGKSPDWIYENYYGRSSK